MDGLPRRYSRSGVRNGTIRREIVGVVVDVDIACKSTWYSNCNRSFDRGESYSEKLMELSTLRSDGETVSHDKEKGMQHTILTEIEPFSDLASMTVGFRDARSRGGGGDR